MPAFRPVLIGQQIRLMRAEHSESLLGGALDELLSATDVALVDHDMGQLGVVNACDATSIVLDQLCDLVEAVKSR